MFGAARASHRTAMTSDEPASAIKCMGPQWRAPSASTPRYQPADYIKPAQRCSRWRKCRPGNSALLRLLVLPLLSMTNGVRGQFLEIASLPTLTQCVPTTIVWTGGMAPYFLSIVNVPGSTPPGLPNFSLEFNNLNTTFFRWNTGFSAGTPVVFRINDCDGTSSNHTDAVVIQSGPIDTCLPQVNIGATAAYYVGAPTTTSSGLSTPSAGPPPESTDSSRRSGHSGAGIAGVVLGSVLAVIMLAMLGFRIVAKRRESSTSVDGRGQSRVSTVPLSKLNKVCSGMANAISPHAEDSETQSWTATSSAPWIVPSQPTRAGTIRRSEADVATHSASNGASRPTSLAVQATVPPPSDSDFVVHDDRKCEVAGARTANLETAPEAVLRGSWSDRRGRTDLGSLAQGQVRARAMDGGVSLAGGCGMQAVDDLDDGRSSSAGSTLPPPYDSSY